MPWQDPETIVAIATPGGRGGIGVVRLSGPASRSIGESLLELRRPLEAGRVRFGQLLDEPSADTGQRAVLDEVVASFFAAPRSYTGEDVLEIAAHGAPVVLDALLRGALRRGARLAEPGEFTQRAFRSGRLDLTQAEAVHDLVTATTLHQARVAAGQLGGAVSQRIAPPKAALVTLIATLEAGIDFAEDDLAVLPEAEILSRIEHVRDELMPILESYKFGRALREGYSLAIVGRPNAGKSSLFNALLGRDRAIVTAVPGTTRDLITERLSLDGIPLEVVDTAGLRETADEVEALGVARARSTLGEAAAVLLVIDATEPLADEDRALLAAANARPFLCVVNKVDLLDDEQARSVMCLLQEQTPHGCPVVALSAKTGAGLDELWRQLRTLLVGNLPAQDTVVLTSLRQRQALADCVAALDTAHAALGASIPHEMVLLDLHAALRALDELTGTTTTEAILAEIFSTFCIGK